MSTKLVVFLVALIFLRFNVGAEPLVNFEPPLSKLKPKGHLIVDQKGREVHLKGVNVGNWLVLEMWMLGLAESISDQHEMEKILKKRFGKKKAHDLMEVFRQNWLTERDFDMIKSFDMNCIRIPFEYLVLVEENNPYELKEDAFKYLDYAINEAEKRGMYSILDMHGAPGRQSGMDHTGRSEYNKLMTDKEYQKETIWLWEQIVKRYKDRDCIAAYDILNEPWGGTQEQLFSICERIYDGIRKIDSETLVIFPGYYDGIDFYGVPSDHGWTNAMFTMHFYPGFFGNGRAEWQTHYRFMKNDLPNWDQKMRDLESPMLIGEFNVVLKNAGGGEMMRRYFDQYNSYGWAATMWSYKVFTHEGGIGKGVWGMVTNKDALPDFEIKKWKYDQIQNYFKSLSTMEYQVDEDLKKWMTSTEEPSDLPEPPPPPPPIVKAPAQDELTDGWQVTDINGSLAGGQKVVSGSQVTLYGGGEDIWAVSDQFRYLWKESNGNFKISVQIDAFRDTHQYAKAGLMFRNSLDPDSAMAMINIFPDLTFEICHRPSAGERASSIRGPELKLPVSLTMERKGNKIIVSHIDSEGKQVKGKPIVLDQIAKTGYVGLVALSHDNKQLTEIKYSGIKLSGKGFSE